MCDFIVLFPDHCFSIFCDPLQSNLELHSLVSLTCSNIYDHLSS